MDVQVGSKRIRLDPSASIGKGGEADVFDIGGGLVLKLFKGPDHPDYAGSPVDQGAARDRIDAHQRKLREFPRALPSRVIAPLDLATDRTGKRVVGYTMPFVAGAEVLLRYGDPSFRKGGVSPRLLTSALGDLHASVTALHARGVVIGDFNDLNVLVRSAEAFLIDADSFQFGQFPCHVFTERFVDPLLCNPAEERPVPARPFREASDWYAFAVMAMQSLVCVGPYGGIFRPKSRSARTPQHARWRARITVFHPEVQYPKPAIPYGMLPDDLLHELHLVFEKDHRAPFPRRLLDELAWTRCPACGAEHARAVCPSCVQTPAAAIKEITVVRGVTCARIFATRGAIVAAAIENGELLWLSHENGEYRREDGSVPMQGDADPFLCFALRGKTTLVGRENQVVALTPGQAPERFAVDRLGARPLFAVNAHSDYFVHGGRLVRRSAGPHSGSIAALAAGGGREIVGEVLAGQTLFWVGDRFGFGFYRAGNLSVAFVFDARRSGLKDTVKLPYLGGQLVGATCTFGEDRAWVLLAAQRGGRVIHQCAVVSITGEVLAAAEGEAGDGSWLGSLRGKCAVGGFLLSATDAGLVRVEVRGSALSETRSFPDTESFVSQSSEIFAGREGLYVVDPREIRQLRLV